MPDDDAKLARRCKLGDQCAFEELLRRYRESVYRTAYAILSDHQEAEDVVQDAFVRAYGAMRSFDERRRFGDWIRRITVNCAISSLRKHRRRPPMTGSSAQELNFASTADPAHEVAVTRLQEEVRKALHSLPAQQRAAITLFALEEMDMASTAAAMGCAVGTAKAHLHRARRRLRELLSHYLEEA